MSDNVDDRSHPKEEAPGVVTMDRLEDPRDELDGLYFYALQRSEHPYMSEDEFRRQFRLDGQLWGGLALVLAIILAPLIYVVISF